MIVLKYTNQNKESITINHTGKYRLIDLQGLGTVSAETQTVKAPYQDGVTHLDTLLDSRYLTIEVGIFADSPEELFQLRRKLSSVLNPKHSNNILRYVNGDSIYEIEAVPEATVDFPTGANNTSECFQRAFIELMCPKPFWLSIIGKTQPMANWIGGFGFPLSFLGSNVGFAERGSKVVVVNDGDVPAPIEIHFAGEAVNPLVRNITTGEYIRVNRTLTATDKLIITTEFGNKRVEIENAEGERINVFNWLDLNSTFFQLQVGENEIEYKSDSGIEYSTVELKWRNRYLGI